MIPLLDIHQDDDVDILVIMYTEQKEQFPTFLLALALN